MVNKGGNEVTGYLLGILGFLFLFGFDILSMKHKRTGKYIMMILGITSIVMGSIFITQRDTTMILPTSINILFGVMTVLFLMLLVYSVVIEVGDNTYQYHNIPKLVTTGTYSLSRHPGVLWLFGVYFGLAMTFESTGLLIASVVFTVTNIAYVYAQEQLIFVHIFKEYPQYQNSTPFILPSVSSIKTFIYRKQPEGNTK